ncbi:DNA-binding domain-containing protein [Sediminimonas qiaohouensis]|uniref:HvfC/BufC N-terminal domain-containing protein n=1 Tax=Sediminimonas qiaohouensis TaxID=552061 RepID=UPI0004170C87|nr:DNA-binding domain-containing protein [Sediminimonas qiaohouensis]
MTSPDQSTLRRAIVTPDAAPPTGLSDGHGRPAGRRFSVYRNNVAASLIDALRSGFPAVEKLIGEANFTNVARLYARDNPPDTPLLMHYGASFPTYLDGFGPLSHIGYLADVARLEQALRRAYHAADSTSISASTLHDMSLDSLMNSKVALTPATILLRSDWPVHAIWAYTLDPGNSPKPQATPQNVLITRPEFDPTPAPLPPGGAEFIAALMRGETFGQAHTHAAATTATFDLTRTLSLLLSGGAISEINMKNDHEQTVFKV